ncbi:U3 small nucleolar RNA-associated protein, partial [Reticulomyxa filosa]
MLILISELDLPVTIKIWPFVNGCNKKTNYKPLIAEKACNSKNNHEILKMADITDTGNNEYDEADGGFEFGEEMDPSVAFLENSSDEDRQENVEEEIEMKEESEKEWNQTSGRTLRESQLFREFRVLGLVCNEVPFAYVRSGDAFSIGTSVGQTFHIYEGKSLKLKFIGRSLGAKISSILMYKEINFLTCDNVLEIFHRVAR